MDGVVRGGAWIDDVQARIDRAPGPAWAWYLGGALLSIVAVNALIAVAIDPRVHRIPDPPPTVALAFAWYLLALAHELDRIAARAFDAFREVLPAGDDVEALRVDLLRVPRRVALAGPLVVVAVGVGVALPIGPAALGDGDTGLGLVRAACALVALASLGLVVGRTVHQLRAVARIHDAAVTIDPLDAQPLYAFSALTAATGVGLLVLPLVALALFGLFRSGLPASLADGTALLVPGASVGVLAVASFVWPLAGMHRRLAAAIADLQRASDRRLKGTLERLDAAASSGDLRDADALNKTLGSLLQERDVLGRIPAWPWRPGTFRGFVTALALPVAIWIVTRLLDRVL